MSGIEALEACFLICKFFYDQKVLNDEAKSLVADLAEYVRRLLPALESLNTRGLESAALQLSHLWACLRECQRIYVKYKHGWKASKFYVTIDLRRFVTRRRHRRRGHFMLSRTWRHFYPLPSTTNSSQVLLWAPR